MKLIEKAQNQTTDRAYLNKADAAGQASSGMLADCCARQSAKGVLAETIQRKQRELDSLRVLHDALPDFAAAGAHQADSALWQLILDARR